MNKPFYLIFVLVFALLLGVWFFQPETENQPLGADLQFKTTKENIVYSQEFTEYEWNKEGEIISQKQLVAYAYKSGEIAPVLDNEIIEQRTPHIVYRNLGGNERSAQSGYNFYKERAEWKQIKFATTTKEVFDKTTFNFIERVFAADTGSTSPGTMADDATVGNSIWNFPDRAKISDNSYASRDAYGALPNSHYLKATNFGFSIPSGATINGIVVEIERYAVIGGTNTYHDYLVNIVKSDGTFGSTNKADSINNWPATDTYKTYGSSSDLWGETWADTNINDVDFGVALSVNMTFDGKNENEGFVDHIRITVYYTEGGGEPPAEAKGDTPIIFFE